MPVSKRILASAGAAFLLATTAACITDPTTGERRVSKAAIGAVIGGGAGYLLGEVLGGRRDRTERIIGAGVGAIAGGAVLHGPRLFAQPTCHHAPEVYPGIGEGEAGELLRTFFLERRSG